MKRVPNLLSGEDLPPAPVQRRSLEKRRRLKAASLELFGEKGYERTSIDEIARRARLATGSFYQHYRSKRQLLLALMQELLDYLSRLDLRPQTGGGVPDPRTALAALLDRAFAGDLRYLGAYRAWEEAVLSDPDLAVKHAQIRAWTTARLINLFKLLQGLPGARPGVDAAPLAKVMDSFFWSLLAQAVRLRKAELKEWTDSATHLIYHAIFAD